MCSETSVLDLILRSAQQSLVIWELRGRAPQRSTEHLPEAAANTGLPRTKGDRPLGL